MTVYICITMCNCSYNRPFSYYDYFSLDNVPAVTVQTINRIAFQDKLDVVLSADSKILKIWRRETVSIVSYQNEYSRTSPQRPLWGTDRIGRFGEERDVI